MSVNNLTIDVGGMSFQITRDSSTVRRFDYEEEKPALFYLTAARTDGGSSGSSPKLTVADMKRLRDALSLCIGD